MRYLPIVKLKPGMVLGQDIFNGEGRMLLKRHFILNRKYIDALGKYGFPGVYIDDEFTVGIEIEQVLSPEIRCHTLKMVHDFFLSDDTELSGREQEIEEVVNKIVNEILNDGDVMYNLMNLKAYDDYTYFHSLNVGMIAALIGAHYHMSEEELKILVTAALLHDIGKKFLKIEVLNAKRALTKEEQKIVRKHPKLGYEFLKRNFDFDPSVCEGVLEHHEWNNGEGYPLHKSGEDISIYARIIKIADVYDAMTSKRPYHKELCPADAVEYIMSMNETEFDPETVKIFVKWIAVYPVGCEVKLSDGRRAIVEKNTPDFVLRPVIRVLDSGEVIDLKTDVDARHLTIVGMQN